MPPSTRVPDFYTQVIEVAQEQRVQPFMGRINLGGVGGPGGGLGQPPGGFFGQLVQWKVAYDSTEGATLTTGSSSSLVDNLNHIRARIQVLESNNPGVGGAISGAAEFAQAEYLSADIDLGLVSDGSYQNVTNATLNITPSEAGAYKAAFTFTVDLDVNEGSGSIAIVEVFRLTDGISSVGYEMFQSTGGYKSEAFCITGIFTWPSNIPRTVTLQKKILYANDVAYNKINNSSGEAALHMDVFRLGGGTAVNTTDESAERAWWGW